MSKIDTATPAASPADAERTYTLLRPHTHARVQYPAGHEFTAADWGLTEQQIGWLQGAGTI